MLSVKCSRSVKLVDDRHERLTGRVQADEVERASRYVFFPDRWVSSIRACGPWGHQTTEMPGAPAALRSRPAARPGGGAKGRGRRLRAARGAHRQGPPRGALAGTMAQCVPRHELIVRWGRHLPREAGGAAAPGLQRVSPRRLGGVRLPRRRARGRGRHDRQSAARCAQRRGSEEGVRCADLRATRVRASGRFLQAHGVLLHACGVGQHPPRPARLRGRAGGGRVLRALGAQGSGAQGAGLAGPDHRTPSPLAGLPSAWARASRSACCGWSSRWRPWRSKPAALPRLRRQQRPPEPGRRRCWTMRWFAWTEQRRACAWAAPKGGLDTSPHHPCSAHFEFSSFPGPTCSRSARRAHVRETLSGTLSKAGQRWARRPRGRGLMS